MIIIGLTGTIGAGKGAVVDYLLTKGFKHYSVRELLIEEINKRGLIANRDNMVEIGNELRRNFGSSYLVETLYSEALKNGKNCIIESVRTVGEIESLRKKGHFQLRAVDADVSKRYERIIGRKSSTDLISYEKFTQDEAREMASADPDTPNLTHCIELSDKIIINNYTLESLHKDIDKLLIGIH